MDIGDYSNDEPFVGSVEEFENQRADLIDRAEEIRSIFSNEFDRYSGPSFGLNPIKDVRLDDPNYWVEVGEENEEIFTALVLDFGLNPDQVRTLRKLDPKPDHENYFAFKDEGLSFEQWLPWIRNGFHGRRRTRTQAAESDSASFLPWHRRGISSNMAKRINRTINRAISSKELFGAVDSLQGLGREVNQRNILQFVAESSDFAGRSSSEVHETVQAGFPTTNGVLYEVAVQKQSKVQASAGDLLPVVNLVTDSSIGSLEQEQPSFRSRLLQKLEEQGFSSSNIDTAFGRRKDFERPFIAIERAETSAGISAMALCTRLGITDLGDFESWVDLGVNLFWDADPKFFSNPVESLTFGPFLRNEVPFREALDFVYAWCGNRSFKYCKGDDGRPVASCLSFPFLMYQHGFGFEEMDWICGEDRAGIPELIDTFITAGVSSREIIDWLEKDFWEIPIGSEFGAEGPFCFAAWRRRGVGAERASILLNGCAGVLSGEDLFKVVDVLQELGMELQVENVIAYHGLSSDQILWLVDNGSNTELARILLRSGLPQERLKAVQASIGNGVDPKVLAQFANQDRLMEAVQSESGPLIVDVMRRLSDEKMPTLVNAALLCLSSQGLSADEIVHWARLTEDRSVVDEWINAGFSPSEALRWAKGGVASPLIARRRSDAGISPPQAASTTQDV